MSNVQDVHVIGQYAHLAIGDVYTFAQACGVTLTVTLISLLIGTILGTFFGIVRCSKNKVISFLPLIIMEPLRNSPLVVQLFLVYYGGDHHTVPEYGGILRRSGTQFHHGSARIPVGGRLCPWTQ